MSDGIAIAEKLVFPGKFAPSVFGDLAGVVEGFRQEAMSGSGSSYECYSMKFSRAIDRKSAQLPDDVGPALVKLAQETGEYASELEQRELQLGCCEHGIDWEFCPAGCEEYYADEPLEPEEITLETHPELYAELMAEL